MSGVPAKPERSSDGCIASEKDHYNIIGSFDVYKNDYNLTFDRGAKTYPESQTVTYSEDVKGWTSFKSFIQE